MKINRNMLSSSYNIRHLFCLLTGTLLSCSGISQEKAILAVDFENSPLGNYDATAIQQDFDSIKWSITKERGTIIEDKTKGQVLQVSYPKGAVGPEQGGVQFVTPLPPAAEYYLSYDVYFEDGFDFAKGGKLPGLTSGGAAYTGGKHPERGEGWSARYMWTGEQVPIVYLYYKDMKEKYGEGVYLDAKFETGQWHTLTQHIRLNTPGNKDALIEVWFDGQKVGQKEKFSLREGNLGQIDSFYFSTFHGGATPDWAPQNDSFIKVDNISIYTQPSEKEE
ncbi:MAG: polysaccharide lyase [Reichenbachiella sp.]|uniref:polysaccharide lyase n=1 Tax=Reichenbachiella sp. TaxID=2184521 RepID=UPI003263034C